MPNSDDYKITISWCVTDIKTIDPSITTKDAIKVLKALEKNLDSSRGLSWEEIETEIESQRKMDNFNNQ